MNCTGVIRQTQYLILGSTPNTPFIKYSETVRHFMKGYSSKVDMHHFYYSVISRFKKYLTENKVFIVLLYFKYLNTSTVKVLFDLFKFVIIKDTAGGKINIVWG